MSKKIKFYKNISLEEFLDENINKENVKNSYEDNSPDNSTDFIIGEQDQIDIEIIEADDIESDISFEISKQKGKKKLILTVSIYEDDEIIKLDFEIKKSTLKKLLKDLEN